MHSDGETVRMVLPDHVAVTVLGVEDSLLKMRLDNEIPDPRRLAERTPSKLNANPKCGPLFCFDYLGEDPYKGDMLAYRENFRPELKVQKEIVLEVSKKGSVDMSASRTGRISGLMEFGAQYEDWKGGHFDSLHKARIHKKSMEGYMIDRYPSNDPVAINTQSCSTLPNPPPPTLSTYNLKPTFIQPSSYFKKNSKPTKATKDQAVNTSQEEIEEKPAVTKVDQQVATSQKFRTSGKYSDLSGSVIDKGSERVLLTTPTPIPTPTGSAPLALQKNFEKRKKNIGVNKTANNTDRSKENRTTQKSALAKSTKVSKQSSASTAKALVNFKGTFGKTMPAPQPKCIPDPFDNPYQAELRTTIEALKSQLSDTARRKQIRKNEQQIIEENLREVEKEMALLEKSNKEDRYYSNVKERLTDVWNRLSLLEPAGETISHVDNLQRGGSLGMAGPYMPDSLTPEKRRKKSKSNKTKRVPVKSVLETTKRKPSVSTQNKASFATVPDRFLKSRNPSVGHSKTSASFYEKQLMATMKKEQRLEQQRGALERKRANECTFKPDLHRRHRIHVHGDFYERNMQWLAAKELHNSEMKAKQEQFELEQCHFEFHSTPLPEIYGDENDNRRSYPTHCCLKEPHHCSTHPEHEFLPSAEKERGSSIGPWGREDYHSVKKVLGEVKDYIHHM